MATNNIELIGIVISDRKQGESSKILSVFTDKLGKVSIYGKGLMNPKSGLLASGSMFSKTKFLLQKGQNFYYIKEAHLLDSFYDIRTDFNTIVAVSFMAELLDRSFLEGMKNYKVFLLFKKALELSKTKKNLKALRLAFALKFMAYIGYKPNLKDCLVCHSKKNLRYFSAANGGLLCEDDIKLLDTENLKNSLIINDDIIKILQDFMFLTFEDIIGKKYDINFLAKTEAVILNYISENLDINKFYSLSLEG
ncbi:DNA repair protein RecO [Peptoniphilus sp. GNH]|nr:DNA repair protein RecO [Peptoniphilus sp. GNH]